MKAFNKDSMLQMLKNKFIELGRTPTKNDIDKDKTMPNSCTYRQHFGSYGQALKEIGVTPTKLFISLDEGIELAQNFYKEHGRVPTVYDFRNYKGFPNASITRDTWGITWNEFLTLADLPSFTNGLNWSKNRKSELLVKDMLIYQKYRVKDLSENNTNASYSFLVNDKITIDVRSSIPIYDQSNYYWKFRLYMTSKKCIPDYYICIGYDEDERFDTMLVIPTEDLKPLDSISININNIDNSKYAVYIAEEINLI
jgi:hypothetical protein